MHTLQQTDHRLTHTVVSNAAGRVSSVDAHQLACWIEDGDVLLIDVREPHDYEKARIAGAFLVPMSRLDVRTFPRASGLKTVLVCQNGFLAPVVKDNLINAGWENVYALEGGLGGWTAAGFDVDD